MTESLSIEEVLLALSDPSSPSWAQAFQLLASHPETAEMVLDAFRETLAEMGIEPAGRDPVTGEPAYGLSDVARAMGIPESDLDAATRESDQPIS